MFFKWKPRLMGGVFGIFAPPGEGKTYILADIALEHMKNGRRVFSNIPIVSLDQKYVSRYLEKDMLLKYNFNDAVLIITELHRWFNSREYKDFSNEHHHFFSTSGQCQRSIYYDDQSLDRVEKVIREDTNLFHEVRKTDIPFLEIPVFFDVYVYNDSKNMEMAHYGHEDLVYDSYRIWFKMATAAAYDTRYFGKDDRPPFEGEDWITHNNRLGLPFEPPEKTWFGRYWTRNKDQYNFFMNRQKQKLIPLKDYLIKQKEKAKLFIHFIQQRIYKTDGEK